MVTVTIGQPGLFPWWGTFAKAQVCDLVVHLDHVTWQKGGYLNRFVLGGDFRNRWSTVPLVQPSLGTAIRDMRSQAPGELLTSHLARLRLVSTDPDPLAEELLRRTYEQSDEQIAVTAMRSTEAAAAALGISAAFARSSDLAPQGHSTSMLLGILKNVGADAYVFGPGRRGLDQHYLDVGLLADNGVRVGVAHYTDQPRVSVLRDLADRGEDALAGRTATVEWIS